MERTHAPQSSRPFEAWALHAARDLDQTLSAPRPEEPGRLSEAVASLISPRMLGPSEATLDGFPGCYAEAGDPSGEVLGVLYSAAFGPDLGRPDPAFRVYAVLDHDQGKPRSSRLPASSLANTRTDSSSPSRASR
ncbi:MAG: hypothetical protein M3522_14950 [Actinomycetota bacterium]|nr:hypothetical protein [Actinomycetota bacterium]